ncbi:MAG TPA: hypothetical protein VF339_11315 [Gammaproteobacteria bacterium]
MRAFLFVTRRASPLLTLLVVGASPTVPDSGETAAACYAPAAEPTSARMDCRPGRILVLPGVYNTRFQLAGFVERAEARLPGFDVEVRPWGTPLLPLRNLRAHERNVATAAALAAEIAEWRGAHPAEPFYLVGYSGGGGMAVLVAAALPDGVEIDRLILVAPAISPDYPLERDVLPHVRELVVNYASERDLQVGWGTRRFGTIDRKHVDSAGAVGFTTNDPKVVQWHWSPADRELGHRGNHVAYLGRRWQAAALLPALDPDATAETLAAAWAAVDQESR